MDKSGKAELKPVRQRTQYTCVATSVMMALNALGKNLSEDQVNRILGAEPKKGARWEEAIATIQYFGCRATLTAPSTLNQIKQWTDQGKPVLIAWNPEGRPWSHASCVFHVEQGPPAKWAEDVGDDAQIQGSDEGLYVWVADPNIPNPSKTYRIVHEREFYERWGEDWGDFIVRRPALLVDLEITQDGRQVMASDKSAGRRRKRMKQVNAPKDPKEQYRVRGKARKQRNEIAEAMAANRGQGNPGAHHTRTRDVATGRSRKPKHRNRDWGKEAETSVANTELQSSFYKRLDGEALQVTPLRTMPDYGEIDMLDLNEMLEMLEQEENLSLNASQMEKALKTASRRPAGGLYGYTKQTQRDVLNSVKRVQKAATKIARTIYAKDKDTFNFLHLHADRSNSLSARILCAAMENIGPKVAKTAKVSPLDAHNWADAVAKETAKLLPNGTTKHPSLDSRLGGVIAYGRDKEKPRYISFVSGVGVATNPTRDYAWASVNYYIAGSYHKGHGFTMHPREITTIDSEQFKDFREAAKAVAKAVYSSSFAKTAANRGMYGYKIRTAKLALQACIDISQEAGSVAYDLHTRRTAKHDRITSFLKDHSKRGRCRYARLLLRFYPEMAANLVTASDDDEAEDEKEAKHEKGKKVPLSKMPKKLQDNAKDESKHLKSARLMKRQEKVLEKFISRGGSATFFDDLPRDVQSALRRIKDQETLHMDVDRWLGDHNMPDSLMRPMWAIERAKELIKEAGGCENLPNEAMQEACEAKKKDGDKDEEDDSKTAGCENLPNEAMQEACEAKKKDGDDKEAEDDGKKASFRTRLTTRIANGEIQKNEVRYAADEDEEKEEDWKEGDSMGRSQLPGEEESNQAQPKLEGNSGYNPGGTEFNGYQSKTSADAEELAAKAEGRTYLPGDEESDKVQPDMNEHGFDAGEAVKVGNEVVTVTSVTPLPDGSALYWVE